MEKIKKIWLWISGAILGLFGIFVIFNRIFKGVKGNSEFKKEKKSIEKEIKDIQKDVDNLEKEKGDLKEEIKNQDKKIKDNTKKVKNNNKAKNVLKDFKNKHQK